MKKYQIVEVKEKFQHAGSKAREDVAFFADEVGYQPLYIRCLSVKNDRPLQRILRYFIPAFSWFRVYLKVKKGSVVLLQNPFYHRHFFREQCLSLLKSKKNCKIISVIHDVECLRGSRWANENIENEFLFMKANADYEIVHNQYMKKAFEDMGFAEDRLIPLEIFDYRVTEKIGDKTIGKTTADVAVAGNLHPQKSPYVYLLRKLKNEFSVNLYGPNYLNPSSNHSVKYNGSFPAEEVPKVLDAKFGLIWDGDSLDCCSNETGNYLRYNNPHKTSLYLVSGLPVIIWKQAAMARFVEQQNVGITIDSLEEIREKINTLSKEEYEEMRANVKTIAEKLEQGSYLKTALSTCEKRISK